MRTVKSRPRSAPVPASQAFLARLVAGGAVIQFQADWIEAIWPNLDADAFAHPYLRTVPEHTRAYLERAG